jgi:SAM-dependent methyltransferase
MRTGYSGNISYRRWLLNQCLAKHSDVFSRTSVVLDVGGKREIGSKGYQYPAESFGTWTYLNIDATTKPDIVADATEIPLPDESVDVVVCTEVLEHLATPALCVDEIWRVLKPGGGFIGSAPFVFPVHGDPSDYYRYTESGLRFLLQKFSVVNIEPMGGSLGTMGLLLEQELTTFARSRLMRSLIRRLAIAMSRKDHKENFEGSKRLTTGWFWSCKK